MFLELNLLAVKSFGALDISATKLSIKYFLVWISNRKYDSFYSKHLFWSSGIKKKRTKL